jgi:hypothetical protein
VNGAQLFATTTEASNNRIVSIVDGGSGSPVGANLASAGTNYAFRGIDLNGAAVPAPGALAEFSM